MYNYILYDSITKCIRCILYNVYVGYYYIKEESRTYTTFMCARVTEGVYRWTRKIILFISRHH